MQQVGPRDWVFWLDKKNNGQLDWASKYLKKKGINVECAQHQDMYAALRTALENWPDNIETREFIRKMRSASSQRKFRKGSSTHKPCTFVLSKAAVSELKILSGKAGRAMNQVLEILISDGLAFRRNIDKEMKEEVKQARQDKLLKLTKKMHKENNVSEVDRLQTEMEQLKGDLQKTRNRNAGLLRTVIELNIRVQYGIDRNTPLTSNQKRTLSDKFERALRRQGFVSE